MTALPTSFRSADPLAVYPHFRAGADALTLATPAKLNLFLEVVRKRPDGYHDLESLMIAVELYDTLEFRAVPGGAVELRCEPDTLGSGPDNLVYKAAVALRAVAGRPDLGARIRLTKRIPTQAGMGGGSSDAAAALVGLNEIWKLGLTRDQLVAIAASIGSDVAFFLALPAAWCTGRGEITAPEPPPRRALDFVLVLPLVGVSTPAVFKRLVVPAEPVGGARLRAAFRSGDPAAVGAALFNRLEPAAFGAEPLVGRLRTRLAELQPAPCGALMSGSGSTVFAVCRDRAHALEVAEAFRNSRPADEPESRVLIVRGVAL